MHIGTQADKQINRQKHVKTHRNRDRHTLQQTRDTPRLTDIHTHEKKHTLRNRHRCTQTDIDTQNETCGQVHQETKWQPEGRTLI
jgi:hypothetical protein